MPKWTESQSNAINTHGGAIIVSAAAGSGKTAVLVNRVISMIVDENLNVDADKILVVTYTKAAAAELKERLHSLLSEKIKENPTNTYLLAQQIKLQSAYISTIHSFCSKIVREYFYILGIDRDFRIADESELLVLRQDAMNLTLDDLYANNDEGLTFLLDNFANEKDDFLLKKTIYEIYDFLLSHPFPKKWMDEKLAYFKVDKVDDSVWFKEIILPYTYEAIEYINSLLDNIKCYYSEMDEKYVEKSIDFFDDIFITIDVLNTAVKSKKYVSIHNILKSISFKTFPRTLKDFQYKSQIYENFGIIKDEIKSLVSLFQLTEQNCLEDIKNLYLVAKNLFRLVDLFSKNFQQIKENKRVADYSDLEHWMISLLYDENYNLSDLGFELRKRFDEILVDEYQDANETQEYIFKALSNGNDDNNLFVVGDVKQSIYGFRQAMPEIFINRKERSIKYDINDNKFPACIILDKNFRSSRVIIDYINFCFSKLMSSKVGDIDYNEDEMLVYNEKDDGDSSVELDIVNFEAANEEIQAIAEAKFICKRIKRLFDEDTLINEYKDGKLITRGIKFSDIAILMRSEKGYAPLYVSELLKNNIPAYSKKSEFFLGSQEVMTITNLLRVIDNPTLNIPMMSVLISPMFGFTLDDIGNLRDGNEKRYKSLYLCIKDAANDGDEKCINFLSELDFYRTASVTMPLGDLINLIYDRTNYLSIITAINSSNLVKSNLRILVTYARDYELNTHKGLSSFISYIDNLIMNEKDLEAGVDLDAGKENSVNIMTVHNSKGLEFPIVFFANTFKMFSSDSSKNVLLDSNYGFAIKRRDIEQNVAFDTLPHKALSKQIKNKEISEELRVLYVALTRAKQKLIIVTTPKNRMNSTDDNPVDSAIKRIGKKISGPIYISPYIVRSANSNSDWLLMCALMHPDGEILRDRFDGEIYVDHEIDFPLNIDIVENVDSEKLDNSEIADVEVIFNDKVIKTLNENIKYKYKYQEIVNIPAKVTVTELSHKNSQFDFDRILRRPAFMTSEDMSAVEIGTAFHSLLENIDFKLGRNNLEEEIERVKLLGFIADFEVENIDLEKVSAFLNSDIVNRCIKSEQVYKEYKFSTKIKASLVDENINEEFDNQYVTLNGSVDLAFFEDNELIVVDYKTDKVKSLDELVGKYQYQVKYYKDALEEITPYKVKECYIYSVYLSKEIKI